MKGVLKGLSIGSLLVICALISINQDVFATTAVRPTDDEMVIGARAIVRGKVVGIESSIDKNTGKIYTYITVKVQEVIKGQIEQRRIVLKELGGQVGDHAMSIYGNPQFKRGERVFLYLDTWADGSLRTYQMFLGKFSIITDPQSGERIVTREMSSENVTILPRPGGEPRGSSTDKMLLSAYTEMITAKRVNNQDASRSFEARYYRGIPIKSKPPEFAEVSSKGDVSTEFTLLGNVRWFEPDSNQPVVYSVNPHPPDDPSVPQLTVPQTDVAAAANAWSVVPGCALRIAYSGLQDNCYTVTGNPGINVVSNNCDGRNAPSASCSGILAWGGWSAGSWETKVVNGTNFSRITQGFISFNPYAICYFGDHCDVQEITTHELGHALGLSHSADSNATMFAYAHFDGRCASVKTDDMNGITFIYPGSGGGPGPLTINTTSLPNGTVNASYNQGLLATGGTLPYSWSLVAGQGSLPAGLTLSSSGVISGTPSATGTSNFTVNVTDAASGSQQKALSIVVSNPGVPLSSQFVSQSVPTALQPNQSFNANVKFLNTGTQTWSGSNFWLVSQNPALNQTWGGNGVPLSAYSIAPGQQLDLTFTAFAPSQSGTYNFQWQLYQNGGVGFFGEMTANVAIQVGTVTATDDAVFVSQSVPTSMAMGQGYSVTVTMQNSGTTTWSAASGYKLASQNAVDNTTWGMNRVSLPGSVAPGAQVSFTFNVNAPTVTNSYNFQWRMIHEGSASFGAMSTNVSVSVQRYSDVLPSNPYYAYIEKIAQLTITNGCAAGKYCPNDPVPRDQMAVFIERVIGQFNPPMPASQVFSDVPTNYWSYSFVGDFATRGITGGCAVAMYCPGDLVLREQMAVFMERANGRPNPPFPSSQRFVDVPPDRWSYSHIDSFVANGLSGGILDVIKMDCNSDGLHFCPTRPLTRAEMAAWMVIAFNL
jgi:putative Ig domain-containing protein/matrixin/Ig-like domain-containing protein/S-layer family protein